MSSLKALKAASSSFSEKIKTQQEAQTTQRNDVVDPRFWSPTFDAEKGSGGAIIRFIPSADLTELPYVQVHSHNFTGPTKKRYVEKSLSTIGIKTDPVYLMNCRLFNSGVESDKVLARAMKRNTRYIANVYIVKDDAKPECEGKVFLYDFGPAIFKKIDERLFPEKEEDESLRLEKIEVFDMWNGANFHIRMKGTQLNGRTVPNYDKSSFASVSKLGSDDEIEAIWKNAYSLGEFTAPDKFKTEEELKRRLFEVMGPTVGSGIPTVEGWGDASSYQADPAPQASNNAASKPAPADLGDDIPFEPDTPTATPETTTTTGDVSDLEYLRSLVGSN